MVHMVSEKRSAAHLVGVAAHLHILLHQTAEGARPMQYASVSSSASIYRLKLTESSTQEADTIHPSGKKPVEGNVPSVLR